MRLHPNGNGKHQYKRFMVYRIAMAVLIFQIFLLFAAAAGLQQYLKRGALEGGRLKRPDRGIEDVAVQFESDGLKDRITVSVKQRRLQGQELEAYFLEIKEELFTACLAGNTSADRVTSSLHFVDSIADPDVEILWRPEDTERIHFSGRLYTEGIQEEGVLTYLHLTLIYYEEEMREYTFPLRLYPAVQSPLESLRADLIGQYKQLEQKAAYEAYVPLPSNAGQGEVRWFPDQENTYLQIIFGGIAAAAAVYCVITNEIKKKEKHREKQMMLDYSNIIGKLTLFMTAGMTIRSAWESITKEYQDKRGKVLHYAYEEMVTAVHETKVGISESSVYENFGKRCMLVPYMKFSSILVQNLKKGTAGILPLLEMEKRQAFSDRKEIARRLSEEAGTKLQFPLMIYLLIVFVIVLVPAFMSL